MTKSLHRMQSYIELLPDGLDSYKEHRQKAALYRDFLELVSLSSVADRLPPVVADLIKNPPPISKWISEVHVNALYLAACDLVFSNEAEFLQAIYQNKRRIVSSPIYRMMMMVVSPSTIVRLAESRWHVFHRGTQMKAESLGANRARAQMSYPPYLFSKLLAQMYVSLFEVSIEMAGGKNVHFEMVHYLPTVAEFKGEWQ